MKQVFHLLLSICLALAVATAGHAGHAVSLSKAGQGAAAVTQDVPVSVHVSGHAHSGHSGSLPLADTSDAPAQSQHPELCAAFACGAFLPDQAAGSDTAHTLMAVVYQNPAAPLRAGLQPLAPRRPPRI